MPLRAITALALCLALAAAGTGPAAAARPAAATASLAVHPRQTDTNSRPWFCHDLDCPKYTLVNSTDAYEVRYYEAGIWVSTDVEAYAFALAANAGFKRLYQYIDGANKDAAKIPMTAPVRTKIIASAGPFCKSNFTVSFFVPFAYQEQGVPKPNNPDVYVDKQPAFTAFVSQSGGFLMDDFSISKMAKNLAAALDADDMSYDTDTFYFAGYDPPFRLTGRHSEVWMVADEVDGRQAQ